MDFGDKRWEDGLAQGAGVIAVALVSVGIGALAILKSREQSTSRNNKRRRLDSALSGPKNGNQAPTFWEWVYRRVTGRDWVSSTLGNSSAPVTAAARLPMPFEHRVRWEIDQLVGAQVYRGSKEQL